MEKTQIGPDKGRNSALLPGYHRFLYVSMLITSKVRGAFRKSKRWRP